MDWLKPIVKHFTYDLFLKRDGYQVSAHRQELSRSQYFPLDQVHSLQLERLQSLLQHAIRCNPFYKRRFRDCGLDVGDIKSLSDLSLLPVLTKDEIRAGLGQSFSEGYGPGNTLHERTGGSTGVPLHIHIDYPAASLKRAAVERHDGWAHHVAGDRLAAIWGDTSDPVGWRQRIRNSLTGRAFYLDTLHFDDEHIDAFISRVRQLRPPVLMGHAHSVFRFAEHVAARGIPDIRFQGVITTAMVLSPTERQRIEEILQSPVYNRYGCEELSIIASECDAHDGMHIFCEGLIVEVLDGRPGIPGKLVITDLANRAMPLIRYEIGDRGVYTETPCACGRSLPRLLEVAGREADFLYTPSGTPVFGISILDTFVIHIPGIKQAQLIQDAFDHLDVLVVRDEDFSDVVQIGESIARIFGKEMRFDVSYVPKIQQTERGKYRFSICNIDGAARRPK